MTRPHDDVTALLNAARGGHEPTAEQVAASVAAFTARLERTAVGEDADDHPAENHAALERPSAKVARRSRKLPPRVLGAATGVLIVSGSLAAAASFTALLRAIGWLAPPEPAPVSVAAPPVAERTSNSGRVKSRGSPSLVAPSAEPLQQTPEVAVAESAALLDRVATEHPPALQVKPATTLTPPRRSEPRPEARDVSESQRVGAAGGQREREASSRGTHSEPVAGTAHGATSSGEIRIEPSAAPQGAHLADELTAIQRARDALNRRDYAAAGQASRTYLLTYPNGMLVEEAYVVGALARCRTNGDVTSARAFVTRFPQSVFTHKLARECRLSQFGVPKRDDTDTHQ